ncbi:putative serine O-acetyltransferase [Marvinbryantia formatexigens DSM 14469]|uniref:Serine O-acetyltransferase n=1 Tax=Marvinbryantia formatexigens DSM 14469 TaxID=478749 RepID=C6LJN3_9FIRM|nr:serine acetyltransferase [Marvinbryantia formatexigens]EET59156.1 putative serine O-acetyltransferase [Marvinbryantia formatexigens DSM 14469]UWO26230.1 serine acetyltransferase [Marvinbryantia formatexigens DSM 14469]SDG11687.1 serine O-acetyltransferase [Marvinbryantia formatexigens]
MNKLQAAQMETLVASLLESYEEHSVISNIDSDNRLNREMIIQICEMVRQVLFPGYFEDKKLKSGTVRYHVGELLENIEYELTKQVGKAMECAGAQAECECRCRAEEIVQSFLYRLPWLREMLAKDVQAAYDGDPAAFNTDEVIFSYPGVFAITVNRIAHELHVLGVPMIPRIMTEYAHNLTGIDIHPGATIGEYFFIDHGTGVVVGETTVIGKNVKLYQGVTLGALSTRGGQTLRGVKRHPTLMDNVTVYSGASILGGDTVIGEGAVIGSNAFITSSVPDHTRVSIKNPELQFKVRGSVQTQELGQEGFFNRKEND